MRSGSCCRCCSPCTRAVGTGEAGVRWGRSSSGNPSLSGPLVVRLVVALSVALCCTLPLLLRRIRGTSSSISSVQLVGACSSKSLALCRREHPVGLAEQTLGLESKIEASAQPKFRRDCMTKANDATATAAAEGKRTQSKPKDNCTFAKSPVSMAFLASATHLAASSLLPSIIVTTARDAQTAAARDNALEPASPAQPYAKAHSAQSQTGCAATRPVRVKRQGQRAAVVAAADFAAAFL